MCNAHIYLLPLQVNNGVLASVIKGVAVGWDAIVDHEVVEFVNTSGEHHVGQKVNVFWPEFVLIFHVNVEEVTLSDLSGDWVQFCVDFGDDWQHSWQLVINEVVVISSSAKGVQSEPVVECSFILGDSGHDWDLAELAFLH